jgi:hypothetical protein
MTVHQHTPNSSATPETGRELANLAAGLDAGAAGEHRPCGHVSRTLGPGLDGAVRLSAAPASLRPDKAGGATEAGKVAHVHADAVLALCLHTAVEAARHRRSRLDGDNYLVLAFSHAQHLEAVESEQCLRQASTVDHVRGPLVVDVFEQHQRWRGP